MRKIILPIFLFTGCIYYGDMHDNSKLFDTSQLSKEEVYEVQTSPKKPEWWGKFNDPQLNNLVQIALVDSPDMQIAESRVRMASQLAKSAASARWPTIDFNGYIQEQKFAYYGLQPPPFNGKSFGIGYLGFNFNYEIDFWGKYKEAFLARMSETEVAMANHAQAKLVLSSAIASTYFELLAMIEEVKLAKENLECQKQILQIASTRQEHGVISDIPVETERVNLESEKLILEQFQEQEDILRHQLAALLGKNALKTEIRTTSFSYKTSSVSIPEYLPANLLAQRPDILAAKARVEADAHLVKVSKARFFPNVNLSAFWSLQSAYLNKLFQSRNQDYAVSGAIDLPIFDAGARRADLGTRYAEYDVSVYEYNNTIINALREVADQASTLHSLKSQLKSQESSFERTNQKYELYYAQYTHGLTDYTPSLEVQKLLILQRIALINLQMTQLQATVAMFKALGGGDP